MLSAIIPMGQVLYGDFKFAYIMAINEVALTIAPFREITMQSVKQDVTHWCKVDIKGAVYMYEILLHFGVCFVMMKNM